jgi:hypothetical protein
LLAVKAVSEVKGIAAVTSELAGSVTPDATRFPIPGATPCIRTPLMAWLIEGLMLNVTVPEMTAPAA